MARVYKCDRCKLCQEDRNPTEVLSISSGDEYELCEGCYNSFKSWMFNSFVVAKDTTK